MDMKKIVYKDMSTKIVVAKDTRSYEDDPEWLQTVTAGATAVVTCQDCEGEYLIDIVSEDTTKCPWCATPSARALAFAEVSGREMRVGTILQHIYDSEIHLRLGWMWDGGFDYCIGSSSNDMWDSEYNKNEVTYTCEKDLSKAVVIMADHIAKDYPNSTFCTWWEEEGHG